MAKNKNLLETRLKNYTKSKAEFYQSSRSSAALLLTASAAAGLGALICPPPAEAAVQYSGLQNLPLGTSALPEGQKIDLDNNGIFDFTFSFFRIGRDYTFPPMRLNFEEAGFFIYPGLGNSFIGEQQTTNPVPAASLRGASRPISYLQPALLPGNYTVQNDLPPSGDRQWVQLSGSGPGNWLAGKFFKYSNGYGKYSVTGGSIKSTSGSIGAFVGKKGYLGVRFTIDAETHYGWIRFAADEEVKSGRIIDWAYEDQPDTPILTSAGLFDWNLFWPAMMGRNKPPTP